MPKTKSAKNLEAASNINWAQYGLDSSTQIQQTPSPGSDFPVADDYLMAGGLPHHNELFRENEEGNNNRWWKANFFLSKPILFGTWDGVYTSCIIHLFGVITFLRAGWIVGNAGIGLSTIIVLLSVSISSVAVLAGIGIYERCTHISGGGGNVHFLISHVLGAQLGGAVSIVYCFGQAVSCALHVMGFAESLADLLHFDDIWLERAVGVILILLLLIINIAGVKWVVRLQFVLLFFLILAALDFSIGTFIHHNSDTGVYGYSLTNFKKNWLPSLTSKTNVFTIVGVFFPAVTGVFAGVNMSGDLYNPNRSIPIGTFAAIVTSLFLYLLFMVSLGSTCDRNVLLNDYLIAQKVSAIGVFFLGGLYISSLSSCLGALYATPRIIQNMAYENIIPSMKIFGQGKGPNRVPVYALMLFSMVTFIFILIGKINVLAPIVTIPFLLTYAAVEYAYFSLAMTFDIQISRETRFMATADVSSPTFDKTKRPQHFNYGTVKNANDLDRLFPERVKHERIIIRRQQSTPSTSGTSPVTSPDDHSSIKSLEDNSVKETDETESVTESKQEVLINEIKGKQSGWYSILTNRWLIITAAIIKIIMMFLVQWAYALFAFLAVAFFSFYIGQVNPGVFPGISEFKLFPWFKRIFLRSIGKASVEYDQVVLPHELPNMDVLSAQLTKESSDYATRERYHQSEKSQFEADARLAGCESD